MLSKTSPTVDLSIKFHTYELLTKMVDALYARGLNSHFPSLFFENEFLNPLISSSLPPVNFIPFTLGIKPIMGLKVACTSIVCQSSLTIE